MVLSEAASRRDADPRREDTRLAVGSTSGDYFLSGFGSCVECVVFNNEIVVAVWTAPYSIVDIFLPLMIGGRSGAMASFMTTATEALQSTEALLNISLAGPHPDR